jgi:hypothetical protein
MTLTRRTRLLTAGLALSTAVGLGLITPAGQAAGPAAGHRHSRHVAQAPDSYVARWNAIGSQAFTAAALSPPEGHVLFAYASIAIYDSVVAVHGRYEPFAVRAKAPAGTSAEAAVAASAHRVWSHYLPGQVATVLDPAYAASLATIPDGPGKTEGIALGERVANALIALRADDGFRAPVTYTPPNPPIPGVWIPTAPTPPLGTYNGKMRPFVLDSLDQFHPDGPPALSSRRWARDYNEVKEIGSATSTTRTPEQTVAARFWGEAPVQQAHNALRLFLTEHELGVLEAARAQAMASVTFGETINACFESKYAEVFWRPITAIRAGDTDGNPRTVADPGWTTLLPGTPNHPEYPSAHSCVTPAGFSALAEFLGTKRIDLTIPSLTGLGDRHFDTISDLGYEVGEARIWGGIHFRSGVEDGRELGFRVAKAILKNHFGRTGH